MDWRSDGCWLRPLREQQEASRELFVQSATGGEQTSGAPQMSGFHTAPVSTLKPAAVAIEPVGSARPWVKGEPP
ncbi:MAG: hypothetical protein RMK29_14660 [Myxococcales bacterium]|nr:hypothetical protein [Myxococcota bacterium]MDW8282954.1 hypothetical protein [Myxococcales bacterium]